MTMVVATNSAYTLVAGIGCKNCGKGFTGYDIEVSPTEIPINSNLTNRT